MKKLTNRNIPLDRLSLSPANVRTATAHPDEDRQLQASILALGVLESLLVHPGEGDSLQVVSGGRRLAALQRLADEKHIAADYAVPCRVVADGAKLTEISLHENEMRAAMHPADRFEAYARLREAGMSAAEIAARAGVSEKHVARLMRLSSVAPELVAAYRNDQMDLETLMAFTVTGDHAAQKDVWRWAQGRGMAWPHDIRARLTQNAVTATSGLARFVGLEAYEAAGGKIERDLFADDDRGVYLTDRKLLAELAEARLRKAAERLPKRWKWTEVAIDPDWDRIHTLHQLRAVPAEPTAAERKKLDRIDAEIASITRDAPDDPGEQGSAYARVQELEGERERIEARVADREKYRAADMRIAGCLVYLDAGRQKVVKGLVLPEDLPAKPKRRGKKSQEQPAGAGSAEAAPGGEAVPAGGGADAPAPAPEPTFEERFEGPWTTAGATRQASPEAKHSKETGLSAALVEDLAAIRTGIVRAALAKRFDVAFDLAAFQLVADAGASARAERAADIHLSGTSLRPMARQNDGEFAAASPGEQLWEPPRPALMKLKSELKRFDAFRALPLAEKQSLFAAAVAAALRNQAGVEHRPAPVGERLVEMLDIDFAATVRPTEKYFWQRLTRARILEIAEAVVGPEWAAARRRHKKGQLAAEMAAVFGADAAGRAALDPDARERVEQWAMPGLPAWDGPARGQATS